MLAENTPRVFKSNEVVTRQEVSEILLKAEKTKRSIVIVEGDRGAGKTYTLLSIYLNYLQKKKFKPFFIGLFPYEAPELIKEDSIWLSPEKKFTTADIPDLLRKITTYLGIEFVESLDPENQREYLAKRLAGLETGFRPIILLDSIYESDESVRKQIEKDILSPLLASSQVTIILSGRGKRPIWIAPEFRDAEYVKLQSVDEQFVLSQLQKMNSKNEGEYKQIMQWSAGCPLVVRLLGEAEQVTIDKLSEAIDILIEDPLLEKGANGSNYTEVRETIQKLALIRGPFRELDVVYYLYGDNLDGRSRINKLVKLLLASHLMEWDDIGERRGYKVNETITRTLRIWLKENPALLKKYQVDWEDAVNRLTIAYPSVNRDEYLDRISYNNIVASVAK